MAKSNQSPASVTRPTATTTTTAPKKQSGSGLFGHKNEELVFGKVNFRLMIIGAVVVALGLICMGGGAMPNPDVWEADRIYSPLRITVAPILILIGLVIEIYAIFKK